jgi:hypothetical protein
MKNFYISISDNPKDAVKIKADWFDWTDELVFFKGDCGDQRSSFVVAVFRKWDFFMEIVE